jgi:hypothetical protein
MRTTTTRVTRGALLLGALASCTSTVSGTASPGGPPDLAVALAAPVPGLEPAAVPPPPAQLCDTGPEGGRAPRLDPALGTPTAAGYAAGGTNLHAYGWTTSVPMVAEAILDQAAAEVPDCEFSMAEGPAGGVVQSAARWSGSGWTGVMITTDTSGAQPGYGETRLVRSEEVVVFVVLTDDAGRPEPSVLDGYLAAVAQRLR